MQTSKPPRPEGADERQQPSVTRSVEIDADAETVWETIASDEGRQRWIEPDPDRVLIIDAEEPPQHIAWWWWSSDEPATHVDVRVVAIPDGTRVTITERGPASFPIARLTASISPALAVA